MTSDYLPFPSWELYRNVALLYLYTVITLYHQCVKQILIIMNINAITQIKLQEGGGTGGNIK